MIRQTMRSGGRAFLIWAMLLAVTGFPSPQNANPHPLEGLYEVSLTPVDRDRGITILVSLIRDGGKWAGEVRNTPFPVTVKDVAVTGENNLTGNASIEDRGKTVTASVKVEGAKITCNMTDGEKTATLTATKKVTEGKVTATVEGTYEGRVVLVDRDPILFELVIKRTKPADK